MDHTLRLKLNNLKNTIDSMLMESEDMGKLGSIMNFVKSNNPGESTWKHILRDASEKVSSLASALKNKLKFWHMESQGTGNPEDAETIAKLVKLLEAAIAQLNTIKQETIGKIKDVVIYSLVILPVAYMVGLLYFYMKDTNKSLFDVLKNGFSNAIKNTASKVAQLFSNFADFTDIGSFIKALAKLIFGFMMLPGTFMKEFISTMEKEKVMSFKVEYDWGFFTLTAIVISSIAYVKGYL